jgi:hypothetical protein
MSDDQLIQAVKAAIEEIEREAIDLVDLDIDNRGRSKPVIAAMDREYFSILTEEAQSLRSLIEIAEARRAG